MCRPIVIKLIYVNDITSEKQIISCKHAAICLHQGEDNDPDDRVRRVTKHSWASIISPKVWIISQCGREPYDRSVGAITKYKQNTLAAANFQLRQSYLAEVTDPRPDESRRLIFERLFIAAYPRVFPKSISSLSQVLTLRILSLSLSPSFCFHSYYNEGERERHRKPTRTKLECVLAAGYIDIFLDVLRSLSCAENINFLPLAIYAIFFPTTNHVRLKSFKMLAFAGDFFVRRRAHATGIIFCLPRLVNQLARWPEEVISFVSWVLFTYSSNWWIFKQLNNRSFALFHVRYSSVDIFVVTYVRFLFFSSSIWKVILIPESEAKHHLACVF